jgi:hypothetical protein
VNEFQQVTLELKAVLKAGYSDAYIEMLGGGLLGVTIPLTAPNDYALITEIGIGIYPEDYDGEQVPMFNFSDEEITESELSAGIEWLNNELGR